MLSKKLNHSTFQKIDRILNNFQRLVVPPLIILVFFLKNISSVVLLTFPEPSCSWSSEFDIMVSNNEASTVMT